MIDRKNPVHPVYLPMKLELRWRGPLATLWMRLNDEAEKEPDAWHWRIYPNGIEAALRRRVDRLVTRYDLLLTRRECEGFRDSDIAWRGTVNLCLESVGIMPVSGKQAAPAPGAFWFRRPAIAEQERRVVVLTSLLPARSSLGGRRAPSAARRWHGIPPGACRASVARHARPAAGTSEVRGCLELPRRSPSAPCRTGEGVWARRA